MNDHVMPSATTDNTRVPRKVSVPCFVAGVLMLLGSFTLHQLLDYSSWEFFHLNLFGLFLGVLGGSVLSVIMLIPFLIIKATKARHASSRTRTVMWLMSPALMLTSIVIGAAAWKCRPAERLHLVAGQEIPGAYSIQTTGLHSFLAGGWLAVCKVEEASFAAYCVQKSMVQNSTPDLPGRLKRQSILRHSSLVAGLPEFIEPMQFSRIEGENQCFGQFALYDRASRTMVIYRYFHD